jgi:hypothetical protein
MQYLINKEIKHKEIKLQKFWDGKGEPWCIFNRRGRIVKDETGRKLEGRGKIVIRWYESVGVTDPKLQEHNKDATDLIEENDETDNKAALGKLKQLILDRAEKDEEGFYTNPKVQILSQELGAHLERAADFDENKYNKFVKGKIVTHLHPDKEYVSFSKDDFGFAVVRKPFEIRVFGPGGRFVLREVFRETNLNEFNEYANGNPKAKNQNRHSWWQNASQQLGFEYERLE